MVYEIKGKVAMVTGGAAGIGRAYAVELLKNGAKGVVIADKNEIGLTVEKQLNEEFGEKKVRYLRIDVTDISQFQAAFVTILKQFGTLDILINNAGIMNDARWELEIAINCNAVVQGTLLAMKNMGKNNGGNGGVIVNIASILGLQELAGCPVYVGTKHFVIGFTRSFGTPFHYDKTGIKFLTMCPGVTDTPLISEAGKFALEGDPDLGKTLAEELGSLPAQSTTDVAKGLITMLTQGENGSVWVSEGGQPIYEVQIPDRNTIRKN